MAADDPPSPGFSLKRWSRRKLEVARAASAPVADATVAAAPAAVPAVAAPVPAASADPADGASTPALPPVETLTFDSDFTAFLQPRVDAALRQRALKKLFQDPRFNVMDGLDIYIDDYSLPDPISPELVKELIHARYLFDPPKTRIGAQGFVEDVPPDEAAAGEAPAAEAPGVGPDVAADTEAAPTAIDSPATAAQAAQGIAADPTDRDPVSR